MKNYILIMALFLFSFCSGKRLRQDEEGQYISLLCGDDFKIWDVNVGHNIIFYRKGFFLEFDYKNGKRKLADYGDYIADTIGFHLKKDTLITGLQQKSVILKITEDTLMIKDTERVWGVDTLLYIKSKKSDCFT